jgi:hypothetical protein
MSHARLSGRRDAGEYSEHKKRCPQTMLAQ